MKMIARIFRSLVLLAIVINVKAQVRTVTADVEWSKQQVVLKNSLEAEFIIRLGDADNLNFNWPEGFDPFCGRMTESHFFPWQPNPEDLPGFDRILLSSKFKPAQ